MNADFDHTSIAVDDAPTWLRWLREELGVTPICGEVLPAFRYVLSHVGDLQHGARLELMDAEPGKGSGFLQRFLHRHGAGVHHLTFTVSDLDVAMELVQELGLRLVGTDLSYPPWRETFIFPDATHGVVIQLAETAAAYPPLHELLASRDRDTTSMPNNREGQDHGWWHSAWDVPAGSVALLGPTVLHTTDADLSHRLFGKVLGGVSRTSEDGVEYQWPGGRVRVREAASAGVERISIRGGPAARFRIGSATFVQEEAR